MVALNYEIDLQYDEKIENAIIYSYPATIACLFILSLVIIAILYATALLYADNLKTLIAGYEADAGLLTAETKSLETLEEKNLLISLKAELETELQPAGQPISVILQQVVRETTGNLNISSITVEKSGLIYIVGTGTKMQYVAAYSQALKDLSFVKAADITEIKLTENGSYHFKFELRPWEDSVCEACK